MDFLDIEIGTLLLFSVVMRKQCITVDALHLYVFLLTTNRVVCLRTGWHMPVLAFSPTCFLFIPPFLSLARAARSLIALRAVIFVICPALDTSILSALDWHPLPVKMAAKIDQKSNYSPANRKICLSDPFPQCKLSTKARNSSNLVMRKLSLVSPSTSLQYHPRSSDVSSSIYAVTIIIFCATWIFKKATYVARVQCWSSPCHSTEWISNTEILSDRFVNSRWHILLTDVRRKPISPSWW